MRYILELDEDRKKAGWGIAHYWIVDTTKTDIEERLVALLPIDKAQPECDRLNAQANVLFADFTPRS